MGPVVMPEGGSDDSHASSGRPNYLDEDVSYEDDEEEEEQFDGQLPPQMHAVDTQESDAEEDAERASMPMSPPPLALRKKDVSLLRESLEVLQEQNSEDSGAAAAPTHATTAAGQPVAAMYRPNVPLHHPAAANQPPHPPQYHDLSLIHI